MGAVRTRQDLWNRAMNAKMRAANVKGDFHFCYHYKCFCKCTVAEATAVFVLVMIIMMILIMFHDRCMNSM